MSTEISTYPNLHTARERGIISALQQATDAVTRTHGLEEVLIGVLDSCSKAMGCLYPSLALLDRHEDRLNGRLICSEHTWESVCRASVSTGRPIDSLIGLRGDRRTARRATISTAVPRDALSYRLAFSDILVVRVFTERSPHVTTNLLDLVRPQLGAAQAAAVQRALGISSIALMPLLAAGKCLGVLIVAAPLGQPLGDSDLPVLALFAGQAAIAVERAHLQQDLHDREERVSLLLEATIDAQEAERERICLEIHDGVAQTLAPAFQYLQILDMRPEVPDDLRTIIHKASMQVRTAIREAREVIATLRPAALDTLGLVPTLRHETGELCAQAGWRMEFDADHVRFPKAVETALYRIVHEAVNNVAKHAHASHVVVRVKESQDRIMVDVQDDGVGFDLRALERYARRKGVGLLSMRKRTELLQGSFEVVSSPGKGTHVHVEVPLLASRERRGTTSNAIDLASPDGTPTPSLVAR